MLGYLRIISTLIRQSLQREMAFRSNFGVNLLGTTLNLTAGLGGVVILFSHRQTLNGWSYASTLTLLGVYLLVQALKNLFIGPSLSSLAGLDGALWTGDFDFVLLKPLPTQFYVSVQKWSLWAVFDALLALGVIIVGLDQLGGHILPHSLIFLFTLLLAMTLLYSILLLLASAAFWYLGTPLMWIFDSLIQLGRFPVGIYPGGLRLILNWVIPVGLIVTVPAKSLLGTFELPEIAGGVLLTIVLGICSTAFFRASLRKYASASS